MSRRIASVFVVGALVLLAWIAREPAARWWRLQRARGSEKMALILDQLAREAAPGLGADQFRADVERRRADHESGRFARDEVRSRIGLGIDLLKLGEPEAATRELELATAAATRAPGATPPALLRDLALARATAWLRLGEAENCIDCCSGSSCLAPIEGDGIHARTRGSERAFTELLQLVESDPDDADSRWLLNLAAMTLGRWPDGVPGPHRLDPAAFASEEPFPRWKNVAQRCGVATRSIAGGALAEDFDGDGRIDVMVSSQGLRDPLRLYRNAGDGTFVERSREAGLTGITGGLNLLHADYDNDGDADVVVLRGAWFKEGGRLPNSLLRNRGDGSFDDVTEEAGLLTFHPTQAAVWSDFDGDGWLDLFVANETTSADRPHPCELWWNDRRGGFRNVASAAGVALEAFGKGCCAGDFDDDGRQDLFVSCRAPHNFLFRNVAAEGEPGFRLVDVTAQAGVERPESSFACWFFDYDQDGRLDLFAAANAGFGNNPDDVGSFLFGLPTRSDRPALYRNLGDGRFEDVAPALGLDRAILVMGANHGDLDNDGFEDLYLGTGNPSFRALLPNRMFRNDRGRRFLDVTSAGGFGHLQKGHGIAFADFDDDGDQDVLSQLGGFFPGDVALDALYENPGCAGRFVTLHLEGRRANRCAIGARIELHVDTPSGPRTIHRLAGTGGSFGGSSLQQEIGLGDATGIREIVVRWPGSGTVQRLGPLQLDRAWRIVEDAAQAEPVALVPLRLGGV